MHNEPLDQNIVALTTNKETDATMVQRRVAGARGWLAVDDEGESPAHTLEAQAVGALAGSDAG